MLYIFVIAMKGKYFGNRVKHSMEIMCSAHVLLSPHLYYYFLRFRLYYYTFLFGLLRASFYFFSLYINLIVLYLPSLLKQTLQIRSIWMVYKKNREELNRNKSTENDIASKIYIFHTPRLFPGKSIKRITYIYHSKTTICYKICIHKSCMVI